MVRPPPVIRVFIVARVRLYRDGLAAILPRRDGVAVVGTAATWEAAAADVRVLDPDIVLLDMAVAGGADVISEIVGGADGAKVVALAVPESDAEVIAYAEAGVSGFVTREQSVSDLVAAIESAARGQVACSPRVAAALLHHVTAMSHPAVPDSRLTRRESEIATLLDQGLSNKEIAQRLCIERATVKNHVHNILEKLEVRSRFDVADRVGARSGRPHPV
jgi:two-component system nitrate/nitrite response regulator NarL